MKRIEFDFQKLKGRITEKFNHQEAFAKKVGIAIPSLSNKLNNKSQFSQSEIARAYKLLDIPVDEIDEYFFKEKV